MTETAKAPAFDAPYPGLRPFEPEEAPLFYGRGTQIATMLKILRTHQFLAVVGSSGCGKSSLVRAGLLPALAEGFSGEPDGAWVFVMTRPGDSPRLRLAEALVEAVKKGEAPDPDTVTLRLATIQAGPGGLAQAIDDCLLPDKTRVLILVDQFEEIFRFRSDSRAAASASDGKTPDAMRNEAVAFVNQLLWTVKAKNPRVYVALTMRSDFLGECDAFFDLPAAINSAQYLTPRLSRDELTEAITRPPQSSHFSGSIDEEVTAQLLNSASGARDLLPLLQHALLRMWHLAKKREAGRATTRAVNRANRITMKEFAEAGDIDHALDRHASEVLGLLTEGKDDQGKAGRIAECLFAALCRTTGEGRTVRRLARIDEIAAIANVPAAEVIAVADHFRKPGVNFLVATPPGALGETSTLDISHESLVRQWSKLRTWLASEQESAEIFLRLVQSASLKARNQGGWLEDIELQHVLRWRDQRHPTAAWADRYAPGQFDDAMRFLDTSNKEFIRSEDEKRAAEAKAAQENAEAERRAIQEKADAARRAVEAKVLRQRTRMVWCAAVALAVLGVLLYVTMRERQYATSAKSDAEKARDEAKTARDQEENAKLEAQMALAETRKAWEITDTQKGQSIEESYSLTKQLEEANRAQKLAADKLKSADDAIASLQEKLTSSNAALAELNSKLLQQQNPPVTDQNLPGGYQVSIHSGDKKQLATATETQVTLLNAGFRVVKIKTDAGSPPNAPQRELPDGVLKLLETNIPPGAVIEYSKPATPQRLPQIIVWMPLIKDEMKQLIETLMSKPAEADKARARLVMLGNSAISPLLASIDANTNKDASLAALKTLRGMRHRVELDDTGNDARRAVALLASPEKEVRTETAEFLMGLSDPASVQSVLTTLKERMKRLPEPKGNEASAVHSAAVIVGTWARTQRDPALKEAALQTAREWHAKLTRETNPADWADTRSVVAELIGRVEPAPFEVVLQDEHATLLPANTGGLAVYLEEFSRSDPEISGYVFKPARRLEDKNYGGGEIRELFAAEPQAVPFKLRVPRTRWEQPQADEIPIDGKRFAISVTRVDASKFRNDYATLKFQQKIP